MSFVTNSSAFGIKPAGTTQAPATGTSLFGQPAKPAGTSLFGAAQPQTTNPTTNTLFGGGGSSSVFGQPNQQQPQQGGSIFGSQPAGGGGTSIFGQPTQQTQPAAAGGTSLFGQSTQQQQPTVGTGGTSLFGQSQPAAAGGTSIFGQSTQQPASGSSIFGQPSQPQQQQPGSLFGQQPAQTQQGTSLFGQPQQQPSLLGGGGGSSIFGGNTGVNNAGGGIFGQAGQPAGASMFGQKPQPFGQSAVQQPAGPLPFTKTTKFNDLPDEIKKMFEQIDAHIQGRIQISKDLRQKRLGEEPTKGQELVRAVYKDLTQTSTTIRNDLHFTRDLKAKADQAVQDTIITTRIVDGFKNPQMNGAYLKDHASFPLEFFTRVTQQIRERLVWYKATIEQIERKLSSMTNQTHITPQGITSTLQAQHATFLALASKTAALDAELQKIKTLYTQLWRARTGSVRDPFDGIGVEGVDVGQGGRADLGMSGLSVR